MKVAIAGYSGFLGKNVSSFFIKLGYEIIPIYRKDFANSEDLVSKIIKSDVVINLTGFPILCRWTKKNKSKIENSRIETTRKIVEAIDFSKKKNIHLINSSAVGLYSNIDCHSEKSSKFSHNYLSDLILKWEQEATKKQLDCNVSILRFGVVLSEEGGAFPKLFMPIKNYIGANIGAGKHYFPHIHIDDFCESINHIIKNNLTGTFNLVSPYSSTYEEFIYKISKITKKPIWFNIPKWILKVFYGKGSIILTDGQCVIPEALLNSNYKYKFENLEKCIRNLVSLESKNSQS